MLSRVRLDWTSICIQSIISGYFLPFKNLIYENCYYFSAPETADAVEDSDDEVDYSKMDMVRLDAFIFKLQATFEFLVM